MKKIASRSFNICCLTVLFRLVLMKLLLIVI